MPLFQQRCSNESSQEKVPQQFKIWINVSIGVLCGFIVLVFLIVLLTQTGKPKIQQQIPAAVNAQNTAAQAETEPATEAPTEPETLLAYPTAAENVTELTANNISSEHAVLLDVDNNTILAQRDPDARIYPASMTKIMTLLVAAEHIENMDDTFTMTYDIIAPLIDAEASRAGFEEGDTVPLKDLMYGIALPSGADATTAISIYLCGSEDEFVKLMNEKAEELGLENTHFTNASGLYDPNHYSTATDIAMLMSAVMENDTCREILGTYQYTTSATEQHPKGIPLESTMFSRMYGNEVTGITIEAGKTGYTDEAGHCLVSYATDADGKQFIAVTAKGPTYWRAVFDTFAIYGLVHDGYPMPDNLAAQETDENGSAIDPTETSTAPAA
ncbi:MAG: D-alanyl-D-alanine carboxypeptidase family protein [Ruminococcus sp.]